MSTSDPAGCYRVVQTPRGETGGDTRTAWSHRATTHRAGEPEHILPVTPAAGPVVLVESVALVTGAGRCLDRELTAPLGKPAAALVPVGHGRSTLCQEMNSRFANRPMSFLQSWPLVVADQRII
jgi:hypothetical protein